MLAVAALCAAGCASHGPQLWRLQVRTVDEWPQPEQLAERVVRVAGVPLSGEVASIAPRWYAITLRCDSRRDCKRATMKLAAEPTLFVELRRDTPRRTPDRPMENFQ